MKAILKIVTALLCAFVFTGAHSASLSYKKTWWDPNQNGMGTFCEQQTSVTVGRVSSEILFCSWFHYTPGNQPTFLTFSGTLVKDSLGRDTLSGQLVRTNSSQPMGYDPSKFLVSTPGTFAITFNSETSAKFVYSFEGQSGTLNWVPQIFATDATAQHYTNAVIAVWTGGYPFLVTKTGVTKFVNETSYTAGGLPLFNSALGVPQLPDGKILIQATNAVATATTPANSRVIVYADPTTGKLKDFTGTIPVNIVWYLTDGGTPNPAWGAQARVVDGSFFVTSEAGWVVNFQPDVGSVTNIKTGTFAVDGTVSVMKAYTN